MAPKSKKLNLVLAAPVAEAPAEPVVGAPAPSAAGYYETLSELSRDNLGAVRKANTALVEGFEAITTEAASHLRDSVAAAGQATKELLGARTLDQVVSINAALAQSGWDILLRRSAQFSALGMALAKGVWLPFHSQAEAAFAKARP